METQQDWDDYDGSKYTPGVCGFEWKESTPNEWPPVKIHYCELPDNHTGPCGSISNIK